MRERFSERVAQISVAFCALSRTAYLCTVLLSILHGWFIEDNSLLNLTLSGIVQKGISPEVQCSVVVLVRISIIF